MFEIVDGRMDGRCSDWYTISSPLSLGGGGGGGVRLKQYFQNIFILLGALNVRV